MKLKKSAIFAASIIVTAGLAGCGGNTNHESAAPVEIEQKNIKELVHDYSIRNIQEGSASIKSEQLIVKDNDGNESTYDLSNEDFFVSIAPYVNETHP